MCMLHSARPSDICYDRLLLYSDVLHFVLKTHDCSVAITDLQLDQSINFSKSSLWQYVIIKAQLHWASLLATRLRIYSLLLNSLCVITLSCKVAARSASASKVEGWTTLLATRWRF